MKKRIFLHAMMIALLVSDVSIVHAQTVIGNFGGTDIKWDYYLDIESYLIRSDYDGSASGNISLVVSGGTTCPGYTFKWQGPNSWCCAATATTANISGLPAGWYGVTITDCSSPKRQTKIGWFWVPKQTRGRGKIADTELMTAYPNPARSEITLEFSPTKEGNATINLYSLNGQQVAQLFDEPAQSGEFYTRTVSVAHLPAGMYIVTLQTDAGEQQQLKLTVVH